MRAKSAHVLAVSFTLATVGLTVGCGSGSSPTTTTLISPGVPAARTASSTMPSPSASAGTSATSSSTPSKNVVGTVNFSFSTGDKVELTFAVDQPTSFAAADPTVQSCTPFMVSDPSRAVAYHVVISSKLTTSLSGTFTMGFGVPVAFPLAVQVSGGPHCWAAGIGDKLALTMTPGQSIRTDVWMIGDGALTPANPAGDPVVLRRLRLQPSLSPGDNTESVQGDVTEVFGSRVLACNFDSVHSILAEVFADPAAFAKGDADCAPAATQSQFKALEAKAGTVGTTGP